MKKIAIKIISETLRFFQALFSATVNQVLFDFFFPFLIKTLKQDLALQNICIETHRAL
jgi:hypothetical protein